MIGESEVASAIGGKYADVDLVRFRARAAITAHLAALEAAGWITLPAGATLHCRRCGDISETAFNAKICKGNDPLCQFGFAPVTPPAQNGDEQ